MVKRLLLLLLLVAIGTPLFGDSLSNEMLVLSGGDLSSTSYSSRASVGDGLQGLASVSMLLTSDVLAPVITGIKFDGKTIASNDYVSSTAVITATITDDAAGVDASASSIEVDSVATAFSALSFSSGILTYTGNFTSGAHAFKLTAKDLSGNFITSETIAFNVKTAGTEIRGAVLNYKNPFNPAIGEITNIMYNLNANTDVTIYIYDLVGQVIKKISCASGTEGGKTGFNSVAWNGYSEFGGIVSNDVYLVKVVADGRIIGKCKIAILK